MKLSAYQLSAGRDGMLRFDLRDDLPTRRPSTSADTFPLPYPPASPTRTPASTADGGRRVGTYLPMVAAPNQVVLTTSASGCLRFKVIRKPDTPWGFRPRSAAVAMGIFTLLALLGALYA